MARLKQLWLFLFVSRYSFADQYWYLENPLKNETKLLNGYWQDLWKHSDLEWTIPAYGMEGYIENKDSGKVLGVTQDTIETEVNLVDKIIPLTQQQKWLRIQTSYTPYQRISYEFINQKSGGLLSIDRDQKMTLSGNV